MMFNSDMLSNPDFKIMAIKYLHTLSTSIESISNKNFELLKPFLTQIISQYDENTPTKDLIMKTISNMIAIYEDLPIETSDK